MADLYSYQGNSWPGHWTNVKAKTGATRYKTSYPKDGAYPTGFTAGEIYYAFYFTSEDTSQTATLAVMRNYATEYTDDGMLEYSTPAEAENAALRRPNDFCIGYGLPSQFEIEPGANNFDPTSFDPDPKPVDVWTTRDFTVYIYDKKTPTNNNWSANGNWVTYPTGYTTTQIFLNGVSQGYNPEWRWIEIGNKGYPPHVDGYTCRYATKNSQNNPGSNMPTTNTVITTDGSYYAFYTLISYTIIFKDSNGTKLQEGNYNVESTGNLSSLCANPTKPGYTFNGWYLTSNPTGTSWEKEIDGKKIIYKGTTPLNRHFGNATFQADWIEHNYTIKFLGNGATDGEMENQAFRFSEEKELSPNQYSRVYYNIYKYNYSGTAQPQPNDHTQTFTFTNPKNIWKYNSNYYTDKQEVSELTTADDAVLEFEKQWNSPTANIYTPSAHPGYTFGGWYLSSNCSGDVKFTAGESYTPDGTDHIKANSYQLLLYAKWTRNVIQFNLLQGNSDNYNSWPNKTLYLHYEKGWYFNKAGTGDGVTKLSTPLPKRTGYTFKGFFEDINDEDTRVINNAGTIVAENTYVTKTDRNLIPKFVVNVLTVRFKIPDSISNLITIDEFYERNIDNLLQQKSPKNLITFTFTYGAAEKTFNPKLFVGTDKILTLAEGYHFGGTSGDLQWKQGSKTFGEGKKYTTANFTSDINNKSDTIILEPNIIENTYKIVYSRKERGGSVNVIGSTTDSKNYKYATDTVKLIAPASVIDGYHFVGWTLESDSSRKYSIGKTFNKLTTVNNGTVTFYPVVEPNNATLVFLDNKKDNINSGRTGPSPLNISSGMTLNAITDIPTRPGFTFKGYYISSSNPTANPPSKPTGNNEFTESNWKNNGWVQVYTSKGQPAVSTWKSPLPAITDQTYYAVAVWEKAAIRIKPISTLSSVTPSSNQSLIDALDGSNSRTLGDLYNCSATVNGSAATVSYVTVTQTIPVDIDMETEKFTEQNVSHKELVISNAKVGDKFIPTFSNKTPDNNYKQYIEAMRKACIWMGNILEDQTAFSQYESWQQALIKFFLALAWVVYNIQLKPYSIKENFMSNQTYTLTEELIREDSDNDYYYFSVPISCDLNYVCIYTEDGWKKVIPYIYTGATNGWEMCRSFVSNGTKFKLGGGPQT